MDERDKEKAMAAMLRQKSAWPSAPASDVCPDPSILAAYIDRALSATEVERWETHFSLCARCQEQIAFMARSEPAKGAAAARARKPASSWLFDWRFLAPVGTAGAVLLVAVVLRESNLRTAGPAETRETQAKLEERREPLVSTPAIPSEAVASRAKRLQDRGREDVLKSQDRAVSAEGRAPVETAESRLALKTEPAPPAEVSRDELARRESELQKPAEGIVSAGARVAPVAPVPAPDDRAKQAQQTVVVAQAPTQVVEPAAPAAVGRHVAPQAQAVAEQKEGASQAVTAAAGAVQVPPPSKQPAKTTQESKADQKLAMSDSLRMRAGFGFRHDQVLLSTPDRMTSWLIGPDGTIRRTEDGGKTWTVQRSTTLESLLAGSAPSDKICWVAGRKGIILRTTDGQTWEKMPSPTTSDILSIQAHDASSATITAANGRVYLTRDAGLTWTLR